MAKQMFENLKAIKANTMTSDIKMIDINELHSSSVNFFNIERIEEFAETILGQGGVKENLIVTPSPTGGYEIISGHRRTAAVRYLLDKGENVSRYLPCLVQKYTDDNDRKLDLIFMNVSARKLSDAELYRSFTIVSDILAKKKEAGEKFGKIRDTLAGYFHISPSKVGQMQNVEKYATPEVKAALDNGDISISTANQIARLADKEQAEFAYKANSNNIKLKDVKAKVDTNVKFPDNGNTEKVDTNVKFPDNGNTEKVDTNVKFPDNGNTEKVDINVKFPDNGNAGKVDINVKFPDNGNTEKVDTNVKFPDNGNTEEVDTNVKFPDNGNAGKVDINVKFPDNGNTEKVDTNVKFPNTSNTEKVDTSVKFQNNTGDKKTISISDPFIVDLVEKLIERSYERLVSIYESCDKPEFMRPEKNSAEYMVGLSIYCYAKENFPDLFPDDE